MGFFDGFFDVGKNVGNAGKNLTNNWNNSGRGEIGKYVSGIGQSTYNLALAPARAISTGQYGKQLGVAVGSTANLASAGTLDYTARSSGLQRMLNSDQIIGKNIAAISRVTSSGSRGDAVSNRDRNLAWQGGVKLGAAAAAVYGGTVAYGYYQTATAGAEAASAIGTADASFPSSAAMAAWTPEAATASEAGITGVEAASTATTSASWYSGVAEVGGTGLKTAGAVAIGAKVLGGNTSGAIRDVLGGAAPATDTGGFWDAVNHLVDGSKGSSTPGISQISPDMFGMGSTGGAAVSTPASSMSPIVIGGVALAAIFFLRKHI